MNVDFFFWDSISKIQKVLMLSDKAIASLFEIDGSEFNRLKQNLSIPSINGLDSFCKRVGITVDDFFEDNIDYIQLNNYFYGEHQELPSIYNFGKLSKTRTIINCLDYIELKYGLGTKLSLLRSMQLNPKYFESPDRDININFMSNLCQKLKSLGFKDEEYISLGLRSFDVNKNTGLGQKFSSYKKVSDVFEDLCSGMSGQFDRNFDYILKKVEGRSIYIESKPSQLACDLLKTKDIGNETICLTKLGVMSTIPKYLGFNNTKTTKTKCIYTNGDSTLEYKLTY